MALIQSGVTTDLMTVDPTFKSARVVVKPDEMLGSYQVSANTGALTTVAASTSSAGTIFSFRYLAGGSGTVAVVKRISVGFVCTTAFGTPQMMGYGVFAARGFTASDSGGTALTLTGNNNKMRTSFATSTVADARVATTGALTAGTRTIDSQPIAMTNFWVPAAGTSLVQTEILNYDAGDYNLVLGTNEGFVINNMVLMGATGVGTATVNVEWFEAAAY